MQHALAWAENSYSIPKKRNGSNRYGAFGQGLADSPVTVASCGVWSKRASMAAAVSSVLCKRLLVQASQGLANLFAGHLIGLPPRRQDDLALVPFFPVMGQRFAPGQDMLGQEQLTAYQDAELQAWLNIAARRAARMEAEGREDFVITMAGGAENVPPGPPVLGVRRRDPVNVLARRLAGFTDEEIQHTIANAGGATVPDN